MQSDDTAVRKLAFIVSVVLFLVGIVYYIAWGFAYDSWNIFTVDHMGVYSVTIVLCGFGLTGMLLYSRKSQ